MIYRLWEALRKAARKVRQWHYRNRPPPWVDIPGVDPLGDEPGEHNTHLVSRHHIAESGLTCPACSGVAAYRAEFKKVCMSSMGEVVHCSCGAWLVASPDTEHGDDLKPYGKYMHTFVRISQEQAVREQYGEDIIENKGRLEACPDRFTIGTGAIDALSRKD